MAGSVMTVLFIAWVVTFQLGWRDFGWANMVMALPSTDLNVGW